MTNLDDAARGPSLVRRLAVVATLSALLSACVLPGAMLMAPYDQATDDRVSEIQGDSARFFERIERGYGTPDCRHSNNAAYYQDAYADLAVLEARASALPMNTATTEAVGHLRQTIANIEAAHSAAERTRRDRCILPQLVRTNRQAVTSAVVAILTLELAKKR
jgi:hypothetical protein